jgi:filamentous hemagglutinin
MGRKTRTFRGGSYTEMVTSETTTLYRVHGGAAGELGSYWTRTAPTGPLQSRIDGAILPEWGNTATGVSTIRVPAGTRIFDGFAAPQGGLVGGGSQVIIQKVDPSWLMK